MVSMRAVLLSLVLAAVAVPAAAQAPSVQSQLDDLRARQEASERQAVARANEFQALDAQLRADQAVQDLQAQRVPPAVPSLNYAPPVIGASAAAAKYPSMPDAALADSNRRVQDAARNRR